MPLAIFTNGDIRMMTEDDYHKLIHVRSVRGKRICLLCKDANCHCVATRTRYHHGGDSISYTHRQAEQQDAFDELVRKDWGRLVDEFAKWYCDGLDAIRDEMYGRYTGEF